VNPERLRTLLAALEQGASCIDDALREWRDLPLRALGFAHHRDSAERQWRSNRPGVERLSRIRMLGGVPNCLPSLGLLRTSFASSLLGYMTSAMRPRRSSRPRFLAAPSSVRQLGTPPRTPRVAS
jgi:hypothetical protein